jgi:hypothetical protein
MLNFKTFLVVSLFKFLDQLVLLALVLGSDFYRSRSCFQLDAESFKLSVPYPACIIQYPEH